MQHRNTASAASTRARRLTTAAAIDLGERMPKPPARHKRRAEAVALVMRAINSLRYQTAGTADVAATLARVSADDARRLTAGAVEIVRVSHDGGVQC